MKKLTVILIDGSVHETDKTNECFFVDQINGKRDFVDVIDIDDGIVTFNKNHIKLFWFEEEEN